MNPLRTVLFKLRSLWQPREVKQEIDEELRFHIEQRTAENIAAGMSLEDAAREARRRFGNLQTAREECHEIRGASFGETTCIVISFGVRMLRRNPGFTAIAVLTLALGIGATSAVFSLIQGVLLTPPPYPEPQQLMLISSARLDRKSSGTGCCSDQWLEWQKQAKAFDAIAGYNWGFDFLVLPDHSESVRGLWVTADYFRVTGIKLLLGHTFRKSEAPGRDGRETKIILGYSLWQRLFKGDPDVIGQSVHLSRRPPLTVIGVLPPGVRFLPSASNAAEPDYDVNAPVDFLIQTSTEEIPPKLSIWSVVGRLRNGATRQQAQAELTAIAARQAKADHAFEGITAKIQPLMSELNRAGRRVLFPLLGAVMLVFLIACANVTGLLLARGFQRQQEYAVRCAVGAQRGQLFRQVMTECLLLAFIGGGFGIGLAMGLVKIVKLIGGHAIPRLDAVTLGWPVSASSFALAVGAAILAGLAPAWHAARRHAADALTGRRTMTVARASRRSLGALVILQIALAVALLVGAGLLVQTVVNLSILRPGYRTRHILTMNITMPDQNQFADFHAQALERLSALPGVEHVAFAWGVPLTGNHGVIQVSLGRSSDAGAGTQNDFKNTLAVPSRSVTADYFDTIGLRIVKGRGFHATDAWCGPNSVTNAPFVAVINEALAAKYFAGENPIGLKLRFPDMGAKYKSAEIIGVVANARDGDLTQGPKPEIYFSMWQRLPYTKRLVIRTTSDPLSLSGEVQRELRVINPTVAIEKVKTMKQIRAASVASQTLAMRLLVAFSLVGIALALIGVYGVLSISVSSRKREIAVRIAVGAQRKDVLALVLSEGLKLIIIGLVAGTAIALALGRLLRAFLFGVQPTDPATFIVVVILFTAVALLACFIPAHRATQIDPMTALRYE